jgi:Uma2 family endonuclease
MLQQSRRTSYTVDDFCVLLKDGQKGDLIDGVIYMASPENTDANRLFLWLGTLMLTFVQAKDLGDVFGSRVAFSLDENNSPEPDLAFVRSDRLHLVKRGRVDGAPDLAVEIVSPESVKRDYVTKRAQYERAGVVEYWIVDELKEKVTLLRLINRRYQKMRAKRGVYASEVLPGFFLRAKWLWQKPLPNALTILKHMLDDGDA